MLGYVRVDPDPDLFLFLAMIYLQKQILFLGHTDITSQHNPWPAHTPQNHNLRDAWGNLSSLASASDAGTSLLTRALSAGDCREPDWCIGVELRTSMNVTSGGRCLCRM